MDRTITDRELRWRALTRRVARRGRRSTRDRLDRVRPKLWQIVQCAVAAAVAWFIAADLLGHPTPFFAPIAAVISLGTSYGQRLRRVGEVTVGVAVGVLIGDLFTFTLGSGAWQIGLIVMLAMTSALLLDRGVLFVNQAAVQAIVISTLVPGAEQAFTRWLDALIGGGVALVAATVVPRAPLRRPLEQAALVLRKISDLLQAAAHNIRDGDFERALVVLSEARETEELIDELRVAANEGLDVVASSPFRIRHRGRVRTVLEVAEPLDFALRNTRVLVRRVAVASYRHEPIPAAYAELAERIAGSADLMAREFREGNVALGALDDLIALGNESSDVERSSELSAEVVLGQLRSLIADLLAVSGMDPLDATDMIPPLKH